MNTVIVGALLVPRNVVIVVLRLYRAVVSPLYGDVCRYFPSCSAYALTAVQEYGVIVGSWYAVRRILRCHPWAAGGVDEVPMRSRRRYHVTRFGFVAAGAGEA